MEKREVLLDDELVRIYRIARVETAAVFQAELIKTICTRCGSRYGAICTWKGRDLQGMCGWGRSRPGLDQMAQAWSILGRAGLDILTAAAGQRRGSAVILNEGDARLEGSALLPMCEFLHTFDVRHAMAIWVDSVQSCVRVVYLFRGTGEAAWSDEERGMLSGFAPHLIECFCINDVIWRLPKASSACGGVALVDDFGNLLNLASPCCHESPALGLPMGGQGGDSAEWAKDGEMVVRPSGSVGGQAHFSGGSKPRGERQGRTTVARPGLLTPRETEVALHYASGWTHKELAKRLGMTPNTARVHIQNAFTKLGVTSKAGLRLALTAL